MNTTRKIPRFRFDRMADSYGISVCYYFSIRFGRRLVCFWWMFGGKHRAGFYRCFVGPSWSDSAGYSD